jgi:peptidyl-prolyl cis-trans isomerase C
MIAFVTKTKTAGLYITLALLAALATGCAKETSPAEEVDLTQSEDLFAHPLKSHPLALNPEDVVVTVEGEDITHGQIVQETQMTLMQMSQQVPVQQLTQMSGQIYENVKESLIAKVLLTNAAEKSGLTVSDEDLNKEIDLIAASAPEGSSLKDELAKNEIDFDEWKENLRGQMLVRKLIEEKTAGVTAATAEEAAAFYQENIDRFKVPETVSASHILISFTPEDTDVTKAVKKKELEKIHADLLAGGDFEALAQEHSDCPSSQRGGALGTFARGQMVPAFEEVAFTQDVGSVSDIVETQFGYHLIKVTDHQQEGIRPLAEVSEQIQNYLTNQKTQEVLMAYIEELKEKAAIEYRKPDLDAAAEQ